MKCYKTGLDLNNKQRTACLRHAGAARFSYNWGLRRKIEAYQASKKTPTAIDLHRDLNALKRTDFPWLYDTSKCAPQEALRNLDHAFQNFFRRCKSGAAKKGHPKFKSRKRGIGTFTLTGTIRVTERTVQLPRLGALRLKEHGYLPTDAHVIAATVSERAGRWFVSVRVEGDPKRQAGTETLGVDVGVKHLAVLSDGTVFKNPRALKAADARLRQLHKAVSRKQKGSSNRRKAVARLARQNARVACVRSDAIHKVTTSIIKRSALIGIESLNVGGMVKNRRLSKAISDASLAEFHRQIEYKAKWAGIAVVKADGFYPSSRTCSRCGAVKDDLTLSDRTYKCGDCGLEIDRDRNAAINLRNLAGSSPVTACGEDIRLGIIRAASLKQEPNAIASVGIGG